MKIKTLQNVIYRAKIVPKGRVLDLGDDDAKTLIKSGAAEKATQVASAPAPTYNQAELEKMDVDGLKNIAGRMQVTGDKREDLIKGILEAQKKGS